MRALLTVGGNPVLAWPDQVKVVRALEALDLHVALDIRVSATARLADYVIPSQLSLERPDVPTNVDRWFEDPYVMYTPAVLAPDTGSRRRSRPLPRAGPPDGVTLELPGGELPPDHAATPDDVLELSYPFSRVPWDELRAGEGGSLRPDLTLTVAPADDDAADRFEVAPTGLPAELDGIRAELDPYGALAGYDPGVHTARMTSRRLKGVFNSSGREIEALRAKEGTSYAHAHPSDLERVGGGRRRRGRHLVAAFDAAHRHQGGAGRQAGQRVDGPRLGRPPGRGRPAGRPAGPRRHDGSTVRLRHRLRPDHRPPGDERHPRVGAAGRRAVT